MEFWGVEVKAGQPLKVKPTFDNIIHLSQASLGESKKDKGHDSVPLFVKFGDQKLVLGTLITDTIPQLSFDLVFEKEFELSHNWKNGSVYFCGYQTPLPQDSSDEFDMEGSDEDEEEDIPMIAAENGKGGLKAEKAKAPVKANSGKPEISAKPSKATPKPEETKPEGNDDSDSDDEDDSMDGVMEDDSDEISDDEEGSDEEGSDEDEDDTEDEESDEDEETPKKAVAGKKRPTESATKTPVPAKKAKGAATPQTDGKNGGHVATPHPSKQASKAPNEKTPKSGGGQFSCKSCSKSFGSDGALQSHTKAKHSAGK